MNTGSLQSRNDTIEKKQCLFVKHYAPRRGHPGSQGQGQEVKVINDDVTWKCLTQGLCTPSSVPCKDKKKYRLVYKICGQTYRQTDW